MFGDWCYCAKLPHAEVQQILVFFSLCFARNCYNERVQGEELNQIHQEQWKLRDYVKSLRDQQTNLSVSDIVSKHEQQNLHSFTYLPVVLSKKEIKVS